MFYEGCTIDEIRAYRELEDETFNFGEGDMRIEGWYGFEDVYYKMCLPEESEYGVCNYRKPKPKKNYIKLYGGLYGIMVNTKVDVI